MKPKNRLLIMLVIALLCALLCTACSCGSNSGDKPDAGKKSVYELYVEQYPDYKGDEKQFLSDLLGGKLGGGQGETKKSAYEIYKKAYPEYEGTEEEWLEEILGIKIGGTTYYTVSFRADPDDEEPYAQVTVEKGDTPYFPQDNPAKKGYNFAYWGYDGFEWPTTYPITQDTDLTAVWETINYNVVYHLDGGANSAYNPSGYTIEDRHDLYAAEKDYYDFKGWYTSADFAEDKKVDEITLGSDGDIDLYAKFTPIEYSITYDGLDGATVAGEKPASYTVESETINLPCPKKDYYDFIGWTGGNITEPDKNATISAGSNGNVTYTANWAPTKYTVSYELNGGENSTDALKEYTIDSFAGGETLTLPVPSKTGKQNVKSYTLRSDNNFDIEYSQSEFVFDGWYKEDDVDKTNRYEAVKISDGNLKLVACWIENEGKTFNETSPYCRIDDTVYMGSFPQSQVTDEETLAGLAEFEFDLQPILALPREPSVPEGWTDSGEKYWYKDVELNGKKYRGLLIVRSRDGSYRQKQAGYELLYGEVTKNPDAKIYWFNYDPIKWAVVDEKDGEAFLVCKTKIGTMTFGDNRWELSPIRDYLNNDVYNVAFNDEQKQEVLTSSVANDAESAGCESDYVTAPTDDKLFLLSYAELNLYKTKFVSGVGASSYCVATLSRGNMWTRSHYKYWQNSDKRIIAFDGAGDMLSINPEYTEYGQIVPAMRIKF